jgi:outer membrane protein TolC
MGGCNSFRPKSRFIKVVKAIMLWSIMTAYGCQSPAEYRKAADDVANEIIAEKQQQTLGQTEPFSIERPADTLRRKLLLQQGLPYSGPASLGSDKLEPINHEKQSDKGPPSPAGSYHPLIIKKTLKISSREALQIGARNSREYQERKEDIFRAALDLDLERQEFRNSYIGLIDALLRSDKTSEGRRTGVESNTTLGITRKLKTGATLAGRIMIDLVKLLTMDRSSSMGILADATITIPLMAGSSRQVVTEPLTQAERNVIYALQDFERFRKTFAVEVESDHLTVLRQLDRVRNAEENFQRLSTLAERAERLAQAGRLREIQADQARQDELRARNRWILERIAYEESLDRYKITLGLPTDAGVELEEGEFRRLSSEVKQGALEKVGENGQNGGMKEEDALGTALDNRLDLKVLLGKVNDSQRKILVAADALRAGLTLTGSAQIGESRDLGLASEPNARLRLGDGAYGIGLLLDLPWERTAERNAYRESFIALEASVRNVQELEDQIKLEIRNALRSRQSSWDSVLIQQQALKVAERRVESVSLFLKAGRAEMRDLLESQESLVNAQNNLTAAIVNYRISELELQRDMGVLKIAERGMEIGR